MKTPLEEVIPFPSCVRLCKRDRERQGQRERMFYRGTHQVSLHRSFDHHPEGNLSPASWTKWCRVQPLNQAERCSRGKLFVTSRCLINLAHFAQVIYTAPQPTRFFSGRSFSLDLIPPVGGHGRLGRGKSVWSQRTGDANLTAFDTDP